MKEYYVYGLIDPRTTSIFYIGKGKGKRVFQHSSEKLRVQSNTEKLQIIEEIQKVGLEVNHIIICENLNEETAFLLEKLLIHRLGRKVFEEGILSNIVPGGKWTKENSYFINDDEIPSIEILNTNFPELIPILEKYPHTAKEFTAFQHSNDLKNKTIFEFEIETNRSNEYNIDTLIRTFNLGYALNIVNGIKNTNEAIYAFKRIWQKFEFTNVENISQIPFQDFDIVDFNFVKKVNDALLNGCDFSMTALYPTGSKRTEVKFISSTNEIELTYYFLNENKKHLTRFIEGRLEGICFLWYPNGEVKEEILYSKNKRISRKCYYPSGNMEKIETRNEDGSAFTEEWYPNGQIQRRFKHDGTISASPFQTQNSSEIGYIWTWDYYESGLLKRETKCNYPNGLGASACGYERLYSESGDLKTEINYPQDSK